MESGISTQNYSEVLGARRARLMSEETREADIILEETPLPTESSGSSGLVGVGLIEGPSSSSDNVSIAVPPLSAPPTRQISFARSVSTDFRAPSSDSSTKSQVGHTGFPIRRGGGGLQARESLRLSSSSALNAKPLSPPSAQSREKPVEKANKRKRIDEGERVFFLVTYIFNWRVVFAICFGLATATVHFAYNSSILGGAPFASWTSIAASLCALVLPLQIFERGIWRVIDMLAIALKPGESAVGGNGSGCLRRNLSRRWREFEELLRVAEGRLADILLLISALILMDYMFYFPSTSSGADTFRRAIMVALLVKCGNVLKNGALILLLRVLKRSKHSKSVQDVLFYEKSLLCLSAPLPELPTVAALSSEAIISGEQSSEVLLKTAATFGQQPSKDDIYREGLFATLLLESPSFSIKATYILDNPVSMFEMEHIRGEPGATGANHGNRIRTWQVLVDNSDELEPLARAAWSRLIRRKHALERRLAQLDTSNQSGITAPTQKGGMLPLRSLFSGLINLQSSLERAEYTEDDTTVVGTQSCRSLSSVCGDNSDAAILQSSNSSSPLTEPRRQEELALTSSKDPNVKLSKEDFRCCFPDEDDLEKCWTIMDMDSNGVLTCDEFVTALGLMVSAWASIASTLRGYRGVSDAVGGIATGLAWLAYFLIGLAIFAVDFSAVLVPLLTLTVSLAFALGPVVQRFIDSMLFVLILSPFEPGDRISLDKGPTLLVEAVGMLTTEFIEISSNQRIIRRNSDLSTMAIANFRRSPNASFALVFPVNGHLSLGQVSELTSKALEYVTSHANLWKPSAKVMVEKKILDTSPTNGVIVTFYVTSHFSWQEGPKVWPAHSAFTHYLTRVIAEMDLGVADPARERVPLRDPNHVRSNKRASPLSSSTTPQQPQQPQPPQGGSTLHVINDDDDGGIYDSDDDNDEAPLIVRKKD